MNVERLERMRDLLRRDAAKPDGAKFDLSTWASPSDRYQGKWDMPEDVTVSPRSFYTEPAVIPIPVDCGTTACAMGLAAISGEFAKEGLTYSFIVDDKNTGMLLPTMGYQAGFAAAEELFDISESDAYYLFDPGHYNNTPKGAEGELFVAERIDDFINGEIDKKWHPDYRDDSYDDEVYEDDED